LRLESQGMRDISKAEIENLWNTFETQKRQYERTIADLNKRVVLAGRQGNLKGALKLTSEVAIYRERLGYCIAILSVVRWMLGGSAPKLSPTRRR